MLEIVKQDYREKEGNDCLIKDCFVILKCFGTYIVMSIRRYYGWCDNGLDYRGRKEFDNLNDAEEYYNNGLRNL